MKRPIPNRQKTPPAAIQVNWVLRVTILAPLLIDDGLLARPNGTRMTRMRRIKTDKDRCSPVSDPRGSVASVSSVSHCVRPPRRSQLGAAGPRVAPRFLLARLERFASQHLPD